MIQRNCPERIRSSAEPMSSEHSKPIRKRKKGVKNEVQQTKIKCNSSCDSECNEIGIVICQVLSAVDSSEADNWIVDLGVTCHICNDRRSIVEIHTLKKP